jgi:hypothetical protein
MKKLLLIALLTTTSAFASLRFFDSTDLELGSLSDLKCSGDFSCTKVSGKLYLDMGSSVALTTLSLTGDLTGDGGDQLFGFLQNQVAATATTITAAQCGSTFINAGAIEMELPEASTVLGCRLTFIVGNVSNFTVDPDAADQIVLLTNAAGDSLIADAIGESLTIQAISASEWAPVGAEKGTWTDSN